MNNARLGEEIARCICSGCGESPENRGDARGNEYRWQDYLGSAAAVIEELQAAETGEPGRSAVPNLAAAICRACEDFADNQFLYTKPAGDAVRVYKKIKQ